MTFEVGFEGGLLGKQRYRALSRLFGNLLNQSGIKRLRSKWNIAYFKAVEETLIDGSWTPHLHVIWTFGPDVPDSDLAEFIDLVSSKWRHLSIVRPGMICRARPLWAQELDYSRGSGTIARYFTKSFYLQIRSSVNAVPRVRPLDYAQSFVVNGDIESLDLWNAYEQASNGLHRFRFSKNWDFEPHSYCKAEN
jgi:hypothetical protein